MEALTARVGAVLGFTTKCRETQNRTFLAPEKKMLAPIESTLELVTSQILPHTWPIQGTIRAILRTPIRRVKKAP